MTGPGKRILLIDWLGQGGIFQTSRAWQRVLQQHGCNVVLLTRRGGEAGGDVKVGSRFGKVASHAEVARAAAAFIRARHPDVVIIQNYIIPPLETPAYRAAAECGAKILTVVHDQRPHSRASGTQVGLKRMLRQADCLLVHTDFVGAGVEQFTGRRDVVRLPLPVPLAMTELAPQPPPRGDGDFFTAVHFGVLKRNYKGSSVVLELAARRLPRWRFNIMGVGAPDAAVNATTVPGFIPTAQLVTAIQSSDVSLLPYRWATQSGALVLAQALGTVPIASAVGGIPEQIDDGITGFLVQSDATVGKWESLLAELSDADRLHAIGVAARKRVWEQHRRFEMGVHRIVNAP